MQRCVEDVKEVRKKNRQNNEDILYDQVIKAIIQLEEQNIPISYNSVGKLLGCHVRTLLKFPRVKALLQQKANYYQYQFEKTAQREEELLTNAINAVKVLEENKQRVTTESIRKMIGVSYSSLGRYPRVRKFLEEKSSRPAYMRRLYARQEELLPKVQATIEYFRTLGQPVTKKAIAEYIGINVSTLDRYPEILLIIREAVVIVWQDQRREQSEKDILLQVEAALKRLTERGSPITKRAISEEAGVPASRWKGYVNVVTIIEQAVAEYWRIQRQEQNENSLFLKVQAASKSLKEAGQPITRLAIAQNIGIPIYRFDNYPKVRAYIQEVCQETKKKAFETRFQEKEKSLYIRVCDAIQYLRANEGKITKKAISRIVGVTVQMLEYYPQAKAVMNDAVEGYRASNHKGI